MPVRGSAGCRACSRPRGCAAHRTGAATDLARFRRVGTPQHQGAPLGDSGRWWPHAALAHLLLPLACGQGVPGPETEAPASRPPGEVPGQSHFREGVDKVIKTTDTSINGKVIKITDTFPSAGRVCQPGPADQLQRWSRSPPGGTVEIVPQSHPRPSRRGPGGRGVQQRRQRRRRRQRWRHHERR